MTDSEIVVVNQLGLPMPEEVTSLPGISIVELGGKDEVPDDLQADCVYCHTWGSPNLPELLTRGVRWVQVFGVGVDKFPLEILGDDQTLACARGATAIPISEWAMATMLMHAKGMPGVFLDEVPETHWLSIQGLGGLHGATLVIVGMGGIGTALARRALAFDMRVIGVRRRDLPSPIDGVEVVTDLASVIGEADHLVLAAPSTADTAHLLDAAMFERVRPGLHLVNVARGDLVDQDALRAALDAGRVAMASLDTVTPEPLPAGHWMFDHPHVRVAPHVSWEGPGSATSMLDAFVGNYHRFRAGEPLDGAVDVALGY